MSRSSVLGIPEYIDGDWSKLSETLRKAIRDAILNERHPIYLFGDAGRGKSFAAAATLRKSGKGLWIEFQPWMRRLMNSRRGPEFGDTSEYWLWEQIKGSGTSMLVIDDIGVRSDSEAQQSAFIEILNLRRGYPTVITGNHDPKQLERVFDSRVVSRMSEGTMIRLVGDDKRSPNKKILEIRA